MKLAYRYQFKYNWRHVCLGDWCLAHQDTRVERLIMCRDKDVDKEWRCFKIASDVGYWFEITDLKNHDKTKVLLSKLAIHIGAANRPRVNMNTMVVNYKITIRRVCNWKLLLFHIWGYYTIYVLLWWFDLVIRPSCETPGVSKRFSIRFLCLVRLCNQLPLRATPTNKRRQKEPHLWFHSDD